MMKPLLFAVCKDCIYRKLQEAEVKCCPECKEDLGPNPEQYLRFDEKLNNIANTIFPPGSSARGNAKAVTPQRNNTRPEVPKAIAPETETVPQAIGASQRALNKVDDASRVAERTDHLSQTSSHESSNFPPPVPNKKVFNYPRYFLVY
ncbi:hypothetical protein F0562_029771 [Nyssa sinensis]|uniref:Uncharacterized protein n=1 Tax=Nyssa sinensis TaxID=561372 RepID=A0A5J5AZ63_9ASTE|nr:hypothetical protein F0562_029771 [Nyssa sinensis]